MFVVAGFCSTEFHSMSIGRALREVRRAKGMTLRDVADQAGISFTTLAWIEKDNSKKGGPGLFHVARLCQILGLSVDDLLEMASSEPRGCRPYPADFKAAWLRKPATVRQS
jgi:transcriptional regulator with XRE-family HTH domain